MSYLATSRPLAPVGDAGDVARNGLALVGLLAIGFLLLATPSPRSCGRICTGRAGPRLRKVKEIRR